jgi:hypothetical protein
MMIHTKKTKIKKVLPVGGKTLFFYRITVQQPDGCQA